MKAFWSRLNAGRVEFMNSLRTKLGVLLLAVGLLPVALVGTVGYLQAQASLRELAGQKLRNLAFNTADKLDRNLFERFGDVQAFAKSEPARSLDPARTTALINQMIRTYSPMYSLMVVADGQGRVIAANSIDGAGVPVGTEVLLGRDVSADNWYRQCIGGQLSASATLVEDVHIDALLVEVYGRGERTLAMSFSAPIRDERGRVIGVWSNRFSWPVAQHILEDELSRFGASTSHLLLLSRAGLVLASQFPDEILRRDLAQVPEIGQIVKLDVDGFTDAAQLYPGDPPQLFGYFRSRGYTVYPGLGWMLIAAQNQAEGLKAAIDLRNNTIVIGLGMLVVIVLVAVLASGTVTRPLQKVVAQLRALAAGGGDLTRRLRVASRDEVGQLAQALTDFADSQANVMRGLMDSAAKLSSGATEIAAAAGEMSAGADSQTQQVLRTSSAMEEMSATIKEVARSAQATADAAEAAVHHAQQGVTRVRASVGSLETINVSLQNLRQRSSEIDQVVRLIADIAAQTNILSLNAAIEAAGAGAAGARFDVVAEEIRKLAGRTAESTTRISATVAQILNEMESVAGQMSQTASESQRVERSLEDIMNGITSVNDMVGLISTTTAEQSRAADQVAESLQLITQVSQQTALAARETSATIDDLSVLAHDLSATAGRFKL